MLSVQPAVTVATSMALRVTDRAWADGGRGARIWPEAIALPAALPGSGTLSIGASAGRLAAVRVLAAGLLELPSWGEFPCAPSLLAAISASAMLTPYEAAADALAMLPAAASRLQAMTDPTTGVHYSAAAMAASSSDAVDLHLNALGVFVLRRLRLARVPLPPRLVQLGERWQRALARGLVATATESIRRYGSWSDLYTLAASRSGE